MLQAFRASVALAMPAMGRAGDNSANIFHSFIVRAIHETPAGLIPVLPVVWGHYFFFLRDLVIYFRNMASILNRFIYIFCSKKRFNFFI